jgi:hypothetical protein
VALLFGECFVTGYLGLLDRKTVNSSVVLEAYIDVAAEEVVVAKWKLHVQAEKQASPDDW